MFSPAPYLLTSMALEAYSTVILLHKMCPFIIGKSLIILTVFRSMVSVNQAFVKRLARTKGRISSGTRDSTRINYLTESIPVRDAVIARRTKLRAHYRRAWRAGNTLSFVRKSRRVLHDRLIAHLHLKKYPQFIKQFIKAADSGLLCRDNQAFIVDLLTGLSTSLLN
jgi:hypothetical protein